MRIVNLTLNKSNLFFGQVSKNDEFKKGEKLSIDKKNDENDSQITVFCEDKDFNLTCCKTLDRNPISLKADELFELLKYENSKRKYLRFFNSKFIGETISENVYARQLAKALNEISEYQKSQFVEIFKKQTGFPDLAKVSLKIEEEILNGIYLLSDKHKFDVACVVYDKNCSVGRGLALPGVDCDGLYMIIDNLNPNSWINPGAIRWQFKDVVNQRLLSTPADHLPEVLSLDFIEEGLRLAEDAYELANFSRADLIRFMRNKNDDSNDFVKAAEFNIRLAQELPNDTMTRDKYYKTAMFVELLRSGKVLENNLSSSMIKKIKESPLFAYSNITRQEGLCDKFKSKHLERINTLKNFNELDFDTQFEIVRDIIYSSLEIKSEKNKALFENINTRQEDEMGNILQMYEQLMHKVK